MTATIVEMVRGLDAEALVSLRESARARLDERLRERTDVALVDGEYRLTGSFYEKQLRLVLRNCFIIDPKNVEDYVALGGYAALSRVLTEMTPDEVVGGDDALQPQGPGRSGVPDGEEVGGGSPSRRASEVHRLQRGRGRPRGLHGPLRPGERSPLRPGGHGHRRLCGRSEYGLHLRPCRIPAAAGGAVVSEEFKLHGCVLYCRSKNMASP